MFKLGNFVVVAEDVFEGFYGVVTDTEEMTDGCYVQLLGMDDSMYFENDELEKVSAKEMLIANTKYALDNEIPFMYVVVKMDGFADNEIIINPLVNFEDKLDYYVKTYDDDLKHNHANVQIVVFGFSESMDFIEEKVYDNFDYIEEDEVETTFKVGDKVKVVKDILFLSDSELVGKIGTVMGVDNETDEPNTMVNIEGKELSTWFYDEELELVREFQIGDKARVVKDNHETDYIGETGTITGIDNTMKSLNIMVTFNEQGNSWFDVDELELI